MDPNVLQQQTWTVKVANSDLVRDDVLTFGATDVIVQGDGSTLPWNNSYTCTNNTGFLGEAYRNGHQYDLTLGVDGKLTGSTSGVPLLILPRGDGQDAGGFWQQAMSAVGGIVTATVAGALLGLPLAATLLVGTVAAAGTAAAAGTLAPSRLRKKWPEEPSPGSSWTAQGGG